MSDFMATVKRAAARRSIHDSVRWVGQDYRRFQFFPDSGTMQLKMGSAPATGAADDALVVSFCIWTNALFGSSLREVFGARARRTAAEAAALPMKTNAIVSTKAPIR
jgi:hypothetical protein